MNHIIIFTFLTRNDYNSKSIKIILFLFSFSLYLTVNALFFNEETIHKIYEDHGTFNISYQIPQILYSTIITSFINLIIKNFSLSEKKILEIKHSNGEINLSKVLNYLIIKFIVFFILIFSFLIIFWFYLSCFWQYKVYDSFDIVEFIDIFQECFHKKFSQKILEAHQCCSADQ